MNTAAHTQDLHRKRGLATKVLRYFFFFALLIAVLNASFRRQWEGELRTAKSGTFIIGLPSAPIWRPPDRPQYDAFTAIFDSLPAEPPAGSILVRVFRWDWVVLEFLLLFWLITSLTGVLYFMVRDDRVDYALHYVYYVAIGLTIAIFACIGSWLLLGGWGPPAPLFFAACGIILGVVMAARWSPRGDRISELLAEKRGRASE